MPELKLHGVHLAAYYPTQMAFPRRLQVVSPPRATVFQEGRDQRLGSGGFWQRKHLLRSAPYFRMAFSWVLICEQSKHAGPWETGQRVGCPAVYGTPVTGPAVALKRI